MNSKSHRRQRRCHCHQQQHQGEQDVSDGTLHDSTYSPGDFFGGREALFAGAPTTAGTAGAASPDFATFMPNSGAGISSFGDAKSSLSRPCIAVFMKLIQMGSAARLPVSFGPSVFFSSKPTQTPQVIDGENPTNHASVKSLVVPDFPASGCFSFSASVAVPCCTTLCSREVMMRAVFTPTTSFTSG